MLQTQQSPCKALESTPGSKQATLSETELQNHQSHLNATQSILDILQQEGMPASNVAHPLKQAHQHLKETAWLEPVNTNQAKRTTRQSRIQSYLDMHLLSENRSKLIKSLKLKKQQIQHENANVLGMLVPIPMLPQNSTQIASGSTARSTCPQTPPRNGSTCNQDQNLNNPFAAIKEANDLRINIISTIISGLGSDTPNDSALAASNFLRSTAALLVLIEHIESVSHIKIKNLPRHEAAIDKLDALLDTVISQPKTSASSVQRPSVNTHERENTCPNSPLKPQADAAKAPPSTAQSALFAPPQKQKYNPRPKRRKLKHI